MHNRNSDPNLVVLQNYFRKIKSPPETSEERLEETAAKESFEKFNAFAGFGPIVRTGNKDKKKYSQEKKRPGRKIFLTVDEAFSDSDFGHFGREMRERDDNYLIYVPVPRRLSNHNIPFPQQVQYSTVQSVQTNVSRSSTRKGNIFNVSIFTGKLF